MKYDENEKKQTVCNLRLGAFGPSNKLAVSPYKRLLNLTEVSISVNKLADPPYKCLLNLTEVNKFAVSPYKCLLILTIV